MAREVREIEHFEIIKADLESDEAWPEAVKDCQYVLHVASAISKKQPKDADELIRPAREGTLRVLKACLEANVERVVLTSSSSAMAYPPESARTGDGRMLDGPEASFSDAIR